MRRIFKDCFPLWLLLMIYGLGMAYIYGDHIVLLANQHAWSEGKPKPYHSKFWIANW